MLQALGNREGAQIVIILLGFVSRPSECSGVVGWMMSMKVWVFFVKTRLTKSGKAIGKVVKKKKLICQTAIGISSLLCEILSVDVIIHTFWKS